MPDKRWTIRMCPDCGCGRTHEGALLGVEIDVIPVAPLLRWLGEQIESEREWGGIAGNACAHAYEDVKAHIEGRDTDA